ncbi:SRPBCC family protein [Rhizobium mayense]|uniref:SRPBCC family protein n=1 Tax=Rhizobium mayense TaxID=1312184 RepID=A0ABT7K253_9HYPH|nr:SRPBCC family protein [Rhizobium mayense]MDL2402687.1 SRPBCC family protein [Rhizobium mayense]
MTTESSDLTISRFIGAPRSAVWKAWSDRRHFERWWIPAPLQCKVIKLDLHPGGGLETLMREGDGVFEPHVEGCFLEVVPEQRLIFTTSLTEGWRPAEPWLAITAIMTLMPEGAGTRYMAHVLHKSPAEGKRHEELGFYSGWGATIDQLAEVAERLV